MVSEKDMQKVAAYIEVAQAVGLEIEVIVTALSNAVQLPDLYKNDISIAFRDALVEWDCL